jgi:hypothetical protein
MHAVTVLSCCCHALLPLRLWGYRENGRQVTRVKNKERTGNIIINTGNETGDRPHSGSIHATWLQERRCHKGICSQREFNGTVKLSAV